MRVLVRYLKQLGREGTVEVVQVAKQRSDALFVDQQHRVEQSTLLVPQCTCNRQSPAPRTGHAALD